MIVNKDINVLSLFDGKSSGYTASELAGYNINNYYSAEIDKYSIQVSNAIHPDQTRLGDVTKWREWDVDFASIDLLFSGFPCQSWSISGKQQGDKDERGMLFWTMLDIFKHVQSLNPNVKFLIENVKMKNEFEQYITHHTEQALGSVNKTLINSGLVSAQNRQRYYWTNFNVTQPEDNGIILEDILEDVDDLDKTYFKYGKLEEIFDKHSDGLRFSKYGLCHIGNADLRGNQCIKRVYHKKGKAPTLTTMGGGHREPKVYLGDMLYRKLTPRECFRLQTTPEHLIDKMLNCGVSNSQLYKIAGNGWTDKTIAHILRCM